MSRFSHILEASPKSLRNFILYSIETTYNYEETRAENSPPDKRKLETTTATHSKF